MFFWGGGISSRRCEKTSCSVFVFSARASRGPRSGVVCQAQKRFCMGINVLVLWGMFDGDIASRDPVVVDT